MPALVGHPPGETKARVPFPGGSPWRPPWHCRGNAEGVVHEVGADGGTSEDVLTTEGSGSRNAGSFSSFDPWLTSVVTCGLEWGPA